MGNQWFLDFPEYLEHGSAADLERIGSFHDFLQLAAAGNGTVAFDMRLEPFAGADELVLLGSSGEGTGGYYQLHSFQGKTVDLELWFNAVIYQMVKVLPERLYIKLIL